MLKSMNRTRGELSVNLGCLLAKSSIPNQSKRGGGEKYNSLKKLRTDLRAQDNPNAIIYGIFHTFEKDNA